MSGIYLRQEEKRMKAKINKAPFYKSKKATKGKKIDAPSVKAAKKELAKAEKKVDIAKAQVIKIKKIQQRKGKK